MEKLLHERLREWEDNGDGTVSFMALGGKAKITVSGRYDANALADEIERYYIPRPRFEDGEPVQFGDSTEALPGGVACFEFARYKTGLHDANGKSKYHENGALIKRPTPKVYDADGVEIKVGDTVYFIDHDLDWKVVRIVDGLVDVERETGSYSNAKEPSLFTHERPVFDAEGVRICKGDTVWTKESEDSGTVEIVPYNDDRVLVAWGHPYGRCAEKPSELFHHAPDSLQRVRDYARKLADDGAYNEDELNEIADRLTALIERGA